MQHLADGAGNKNKLCRLTEPQNRQTTHLNARTALKLACAGRTGIVSSLFTHTVTILPISRHASEKSALTNTPWCYHTDQATRSITEQPTNPPESTHSLETGVCRAHPHRQLAVHPHWLHLAKPSCALNPSSSSGSSSSSAAARWEAAGSAVEACNALARWAMVAISNSADAAEPCSTAGGAADHAEP
jgi:hypothetical protein